MDFGFSSLSKLFPHQKAPSAQSKSLGSLPVLSPAQMKTNTQLETFLEIYERYYRPNANLNNLNEYHVSTKFENHKKTAKVYFNASQMTREDAKVVIKHREPTNLGNISLYNSDLLLERYGYLHSPYNDRNIGKEDFSSFADLPNTACVYTETLMWPEPGQPKNFEFALLNVPAPALDSPKQPNYKYYMGVEETLNVERYRKEMDFLAKVVVQSVLDHKDKAFQGKGIKALVLNDYGQGCFLACVSPKHVPLANKAFFDSLVDELAKHVQDLKDFPIIMAETHDKKNDRFEKQFVQPLKQKGFTNVTIRTGKFKTLTKEHELMVNAWDPHSMVGNGNDNDHSWDGFTGMSTAGLLTCAPHLNELLLEDAPYMGLK